jgi:hypothetical protein
MIVFFACQATDQWLSWNGHLFWQSLRGVEKNWTSIKLKVHY